ncbi:MAG: FAD-dependent oxidoreductase [Pseudomonadota bacterium]|nr:FAD-dependent oxidoreductase [Pseudomonadota bacterium]
MDTSHSSIAIVGAGMAGLACATALQSAGHDVRVFDKGRGPGGRMAARRAEICGETVSFDHGAQYFTARDAGFREAVNAWANEGVVAAWSAAEKQGGDTAWVGTPGMNGPIRAMADALAETGRAVQWGVRIEKVSRSGDQWTLESGDAAWTADTVLVCIPAEQASDLLQEPAPAFAAIAAGVTSEPCWAVMAAFEERLPIEADCMRDPDAAISWAARNSAKPERAGTETWMLHASPARSREIIDLPKEEAAEVLLSQFFSQMGAPVTNPIHLVAHRWLYAMPSKVEGEPARYDAEAKLGMAGDYLHSPRVEGAWISGNALAKRVMAG